jgi:hypothetical protein
MEKRAPELVDVEEWFKQDSLHRLPLFALAFGVHSVVGDGRSFQMSGQELLIEMARLERERVRSFAREHDTNEKWLERILALSIFTSSGLGQNSITD